MWWCFFKQGTLRGVNGKQLFIRGDVGNHGGQTTERGRAASPVDLDLKRPQTRGDTD